MYQNAIKLGLERLAVNATDADTLSFLGHYYANLGERELALQYMAKATALAPQSMYIYYMAATTLAALGDSEQALQALTKAIELGYSRQLASVDAGLAHLRTTQGFSELLSQG
jgi:tetratricopeptide (TPR) repeat protein